MDVNISFERLHKGQLTVQNSKARFKILCCGRRWGKSLLMQINAILKLIENNKNVAYITQTYQLSKEFYNQLLNKIPKQLIKAANASELRITLITNSYIQFFSGEGSTLNNSQRGRKWHLVLVDEACYIDNLEDKWNNIIRPTLIDYSGEAIIVSTPKGFDYFNTLYHKGLSDNLEGFESFHFSTFENPYLPQSEKDIILKTSTELTLLQEYKAIPQSDGLNPFGIEAINRNTIKGLSNKESVIYGIDLAKTFDYTVISGLDSINNMSYFNRFQSKSWSDTKDIILNLPSNIPKVIDATGVGDVIYDDLIKLNIQNLHPFKFTKASKPKLIIKLIEDVQNDRIKFNSVTAEEMKVAEYLYKSGDYIAYQARQGYHDDTWISLALCNYYKETYQSNTNWKLYSF